MNIQHLESLNDVVERITGIKQRETIPDDVVRSADQIELVDMTPEALRRRMAHGNIYPAEQDRRRARQLLPGRATSPPSASWRCCGSPTGSTRRSRSTAMRTASPSPWETRERVVVAITGAPGGEDLIRRAGADGDAGPRRAPRCPRPGRRRPRRPVRATCSTSTATCSASSAARTTRSSGGDVASALVEFARAENATQLVLGATRRSRWAELTSRLGRSTA